MLLEKQNSNRRNYPCAANNVNKAGDLVQPLDVSAASVDGRADGVQRGAVVADVVGQGEGGRQQPGDEHLTDLGEQPTT